MKEASRSSKKRQKPEGRAKKKTLDESLFDKRTLELNLRLKRITKEDYQKYLDSLPDLSSIWKRQNKAINHDKGD